MTGQSNKKNKFIKKMVKNVKNINLHVQIPSLCNLMKSADLYIGSGGTTTWERCCLGLPSIVISTAKNQITYNEKLHNKGVVNYLGTTENVSEKKIISSILKFFNKPKRKTMSENAMKITNGRGVSLIAKEFIKK